MPEIGTITGEEAAALTGLAPVAHDSGTLLGKRAIAGGRRALRHVMFPAALVAAHHNPSHLPRSRVGMHADGSVTLSEDDFSDPSCIFRQPDCEFLPLIRSTFRSTNRSTMTGDGIAKQLQIGMVSHQAGKSSGEIVAL